MNHNFPLEFSVDKITKMVYINRVFAADLQLVWAAFTQPELLDQWVAPKPWTSKTKYMNFEVGGKRFYAMVSPEGQEHWSIQEYTSITPKTNFKLFNAFADIDENPQLPGSHWEYTFEAQNETTMVKISIYNESLERLEKMIVMGFKDGFSMSITNLETLLMVLSQNRFWF